MNNSRSKSNQFYHSVPTPTVRTTEWASCHVTSHVQDLDHNSPGMERSPLPTADVNCSSLKLNPLANHSGLSFLSRLSGLADLSRNSSGVFCRICHEGEQGGERLISPCSCTGSVGMVHRSCVEKWLSTVNHDTCELCRRKLNIARHPRPFTQWLCSPAMGDDHRNLLGDFFCFLLLTPLAAVSTYMCGSGAAYYYQEKQSEAVGLICLTSVLVLIYLIWLLLSIRYHCLVV
jgi:hypothetical protein